MNDHRTNKDVRIALLPEQRVVDPYRGRRRAADSLDNPLPRDTDTLAQLAARDVLATLEPPPIPISDVSCSTNDENSAGSLDPRGRSHVTLKRPKWRKTNSPQHPLRRLLALLDGPHLT